MDEEVLKRTLECPICLVIPRKAKIYSCCNGHIICELCLRDLPLPQNCPRGGCSFNNPNPCRVLVLEGLIERLTMEVSCIMARDGCPVTMVQGKKLDDHERCCRFRKVQCICWPCPIQQVSIESLLAHAINDHKIGESAKKFGLRSSSKSTNKRNEGDLENMRWLP